MTFDIKRAQKHYPELDRLRKESNKHFAKAIDDNGSIQNMDEFEKGFDIATEAEIVGQRAFFDAFGITGQTPLEEDLEKAGRLRLRNS